MTTLTVGPLIGSVADADRDTGEDLAELAAAPTDGGPRLQNLLAAIDGRYVEVVWAPLGRGPVVRNAVIWDIAGPARLRPGDLVLAVGVAAGTPAFAELADLAGQARAAGVIAKGPLDESWVSPIARRSAVAVLAVPRDLGWDEVHALVRKAIDTAPRVDDAEPIRDLHALTAAAAACLGRPVQIHDADMRLLAFSGLGDGCNTPGPAVLAGQAPLDLTERLRGTDVLERVRGSDAPLRVGSPGGCSPVMTAIRAGADVVGFVWAWEGAGRIAPEHEATLVETARQASALVLRLREAENVERRFRRDLLRSVIEGTASVSVLASRLGIDADDRFRLLGFQPLGSGCRQPLEQLQVHSLVALRVEVAAGGGATATSGNRTYVLLPSAERTESDVRELASEILGRTADQLGLAMVAAISNTLPGVAGLPTAKREVDRVLQLLVRSDAPRLATFEEFRSKAVLAELRELAGERPHLLEGRIEALREMDRTQNTQYIPTLRAYFDAACDPVEASKRLYVHRNTLRYRLRRIKERCGLDLLDPAERLIAELQLRLMTEP